MTRILFLSLLLIFIVGCDDNQSQKTSVYSSANFIAQANVLLDEYQSESTFMGSVVILKNGDPLLARTIGYANVSQRIFNSESTQYRIGSVSKSYTAALIFQAIEQEKLSLDTKLVEFFPNFPEAERITIEHLLQHRSGIASYTKDPSFWEYHTVGISKSELLSRVSNMPHGFAPGSGAEYSNSNYFLLACILELIYNQSYSEVLRQQITTPFNFANTAHPEWPNIRAKEALSYQFSSSWSELPNTHFSASFGAGSLVTTASDLANFMHQLSTGNIVSEASLRLMQSQKNGFGMGLELISVAEQEGYGHGGKIDGYEAVAVHFAEGDITLAITANATTENVKAIAVKLVKTYFGENKEPITEKEASVYAGVYDATDSSSEKLVFIVEEGELTLVIMNEFKERLIYKGNGRFLFEQLHAAPMMFAFSSDGQTVTQTQGNYEGTYVRQATAHEPD